MQTRNAIIGALVAIVLIVGGVALFNEANESPLEEAAEDISDAADDVADEVEDAVDDIDDENQ